MNYPCSVRLVQHVVRVKLHSLLCPIAGPSPPGKSEELWEEGSGCIDLLRNSFVRDSIGPQF